ncbi:MAG: T9SS type A sorting domain-containing protein [Cytophagales bacterium]|nr:T9SS type A sorting domain-containing protein [Cytophagales bacterium]
MDRSPAGSGCHQGCQSACERSLAYYDVPRRWVSFNGYNDQWLTMLNDKGFPIPQEEDMILNQGGLTLNWNLDTKYLTVGIHTDTIVATVEGLGQVLLPIRVRVLDKPPVWTVDPAMFDPNHSMTVISNFTINSGPASVDTMDIISVWKGNELRGVGKITEVFSRYVAYISVYGHAGENDTLQFRVWDASAGAEYFAKAANPLLMQFDKIYGTTKNPILLNLNTASDRLRYIVLNPGWNWVSFNSVLPDMSVGSVLRGIDATSGDMIKTMNASSMYSATNGWVSMNGLDTIRMGQGYGLYLANGGTLVMSGINSTLKTMVLFPGWNLIGNPAQTPTPINQSFAFGTRPYDGSVIKSSNGIAEFDSLANHWVGTLASVDPYKAYRVRMGKSNALSFLANQRGHVVFNPSDYEFNMVLTAQIETALGDLIEERGLQLSAYVDGQLRGQGELLRVEGMNDMFHIFIYSNYEKPELISFEINDGNGTVVASFNKVMAFDPNARMGNLDVPYRFALSDLGPQNAESAGEELTMEAYPVPLKDQLNVGIRTAYDGPVRLRLVDNMGNVILTRVVELHAGYSVHPISLLPYHLPNGVYILHLSGFDINTSRILVKTE